MPNDHERLVSDARAKLDEALRDVPAGAYLRSIDVTVKRDFLTQDRRFVITLTVIMPHGRSWR